MTDQAIADRKKNATMYIWLVYLAFFFIEPIFNRHPRLIVATGVVTAIFLALYFTYIHTRSAALRLWLIGGIFLLGMVSLPWNGGGSVFFIYAASLLPFSIVSVPVVLALFGVETVGVAADWCFFHAHLSSAAMAAFLSLVIGGSNIFFAQQARANCRLRQAQEENIALAAVAERERIARDLHDVLGHTLSVIVLKAELAGRLLEQNPQRAAAEIADVERTARTALAEVREAIGGYRARGLPAEIEAARRTLDAAGVTLHCDVLPESAARLGANQETVLALALREAVTNIVRHAHATRCTLHFCMEDGQHRLSVEDDGNAADAPEGNGLRGMRERVEALGGQMSLDRRSGTRVRIALPSGAAGQAA